MPTSSSKRQQRFLPYRFQEHGLQARVERCTFDRALPAGIAPDVERHLLDLSAQRFESATIELAVTLPTAILTEVVPPAERDAIPARILALVQCHSSRLRVAHVFAPGPTTAATYTGSIQLERDDIAGAVEITFMLVRTERFAATDEGYGVAVGSRLASSRPWEIRFDANIAPRGDYLDVREEDFREAGAARFASPDAMYQLDTDGETPILWLNSKHKRITSVLRSAASVGRVARTRDVAFDRISVSVWIRLFLHAARDVVRGDESATWKTAVLRHWLPSLYPEAMNHESRVEELREELADADEGRILGRLDLAIQAESDTARLFESLTDEIES